MKLEIEEELVLAKLHASEALGRAEGWRQKFTIYYHLHKTALWWFFGAGFTLAFLLGKIANRLV